MEKRAVYRSTGTPESSDFEKYFPAVQKIQQPRLKCKYN